MTTPFRKIEVLAYDERWVEMFEVEAERLRDILTEGIVEIHHIGSTSVPSMAAKPIIDIMPEVSSIELLDQFDEAMERAGYHVKGEFGIPGRRFYLKGLVNRTHHVHAFASGSEGLVRHLALRDYLRHHDQEAEDYGKLKRKLAEVHRFDNDKYCDEKFEYVQNLEKRALAWLLSLGDS